MTHLKRLERVQHKFLTWLATRARGADELTSREYRDLLSFFDVQSLEARRTQFDLMYLRSIFSGKIDSSYLLGCFSLHGPRPTCNVSLFNVPFTRVSSVNCEDRDFYQAGNSGERSYSSDSPGRFLFGQF